jgi:ribosomal protein L40E
MEEGLINKHKVCKSCGETLGPGVRRCPKCQSDDFRPLTREEANGPPRLVHALAGRPMLESAYDPNKIEEHVTNVFVV